jgi:hypothetical protein
VLPVSLDCSLLLGYITRVFGGTCTKPVKQAVIYLFVSGIEFASLFMIFLFDFGTVMSV